MKKRQAGELVTDLTWIALQTWRLTYSEHVLCIFFIFFQVSLYLIFSYYMINWWFDIHAIMNAFLKTMITNTLTVWFVYEALIEILNTRMVLEIPKMWKWDIQSQMSWNISVKSPELNIWLTLITLITYMNKIKWTRVFSVNDITSCAHL